MQKTAFTKYKDNLFDLVFPRFCIGCKKEGELLCGSCSDRLAIRPQKICPVCKMADQPKNCAGSRLDDLWTLACYQDYLVADSIWKIKYGYSAGLVKDFWSRYLEKFWPLAQAGICKNALLIPVPLHRKRFLERGFNQSELIAQELAGLSNLAVNSDLLKRKIYNEPQVGLSASRRRENIKGIFGVDYQALSGCWGREAILIDDVYTTGSTMSECAKVLKTAGFKRVSGLVLAVD